MKIACFDEYRVGIVEGEHVHDVTQALPGFLDSLPRQRINWIVANWPQAGEAMRRRLAHAPRLPLAGVTLRAANPAPAHVFAAPANYRKHIGELGAQAVTKTGRSAREQGFFLKAPASVAGAGEGIALPRGSRRRFDHEAELAVVIGKPGRNVPRAQAMDHVFGYACLIDATMRIEPGTGEEERSMRKSFEGFTPLGPWLVTADEVPEPQACGNRLWVNGQIRQEANTRDMIVGIAELVELVSSVLPISPGDVIATGTPEGVGPFVPGDTLRIAIDGVGEMTMSVREQPAVAPRPF